MTLNSSTLILTGPLWCRPDRAALPTQKGLYVTQLIYPTAAELRVIDQQLLPTLTLDDPIFDQFPIKDSDYDLLIWEQRDNYIGLQQVRGLNGAPPRVKAIGAKQYQSKPAAYGEFEPIDEMEITRRRRWGSFNEIIDVSDLVRERQDQLLNRQVNRIRQILWTLVVNGIFQVLDDKGAILHQDSFTPRTITGIYAWSDATNSTPLGDFRNVQYFARGYSMSFGPGSKAFMNLKTANRLLANTNPADLYGRRSMGLSTLNTLGLVNQLYAGEGLPTIVVFDEGYYDDSGVFQLFIPDGKVVVFGKRPNNAALGEFRHTRNANNPNAAPGPYSKLIDEGEYKVPRSLEVHRGFNGGPVLFFPSAIVVMNV